MVTLICSHCNQTYETTKSTHKVGLWRGQTQFYCSPKCVGLAQRVVGVEMPCDECGKAFTRKPSENKVSKSGLRFCSRQCSIVNRGLQRKIANANQPKSLKPPKPPKAPRSVPRTSVPPVDSRTKGDLFSSRSSWQSARSSIQRSAREAYLQSHHNPSCGAIIDRGPCGYSKHVEVAHRRDVADFPDSALISEINDLSNLVALCPTHHWEFDNGGFDGLI